MPRSSSSTGPRLPSASPLAAAAGLAGALALLACAPAVQDAPSDPPEPTEASADAGVPDTIDFDAGYSGTPLRSASLSADAGLEVFAEGEGQAAETGKRVSFHFSGYDAASGDRVMGTEEWPARLVLGSPSTDPVGLIMQEAVDGLRPGARVRVEIPAELANATRSEQEGKLGDLWVTLEVTGIDDPPQPRGLSAFAGEPLSATERDGLEIYDFAEGEGPEAVDGDRAEFHYVITTLEGERLLDTHAPAVPVEMTVGANSGVRGISRGLRGVKVGSLRKLVVPAELGFDAHAPEPYPRETDMIVYIEVTGLEPGPDR